MAHILLVEPDRLLAEMYLEALMSAGYGVIVCAGAQTAIQAADEQRPDLVILELQLVEHSGVEFLYEFRSYPDWQAVPVLVQSSIPPEEFQDNRQVLQRELGVAAYLYKPQTSLQQLVRTVNRQLVISV